MQGIRRARGSIVWGRIVGMTAASALLLSGLVVAGGVSIAPAAAQTPGPAPIEQRGADTVTADALPTVQIDSGIVWSQVVSGRTVYAGGEFSQARPAGAAPGRNLMPRANLLAYDIETGVATSFAPVIEGAVKSLAVSPDGKTLYVGGSFVKVNGVTRYNLAAFDTATGTLLDSFKPAIGGSYVNAIVATDTTVYVGGLIGAARGVTRTNLAAMSASNGALLSWAPVADRQVDAMVLSPTGDKIVIGGRFVTVNGATSRGVAALGLTDGASLPFAITSVVKNGSNAVSSAGRAGIWNLTTDATGAVYGTGWVYGGVSVGNLEGIFSADGATGEVRWIADCHGDHYGVYSDGTNVYSTSHEHDCQTAGGMPQRAGNPGNMKHASVYTAATKGTLTRSPSTGGTYVDWSGYPAPAAVNWYPDWTTGTASDQGQAGWTITGNGDYVVVGGEFPAVNGQRQQGLVRFARTPSTGANEGPRLSGAEWAPTARSATTGTARVQIDANWDRDDLNLTYELWAQGGTAPIATRTVSSTYWYTPTITFSQSGLAPGTQRTYRVIARDADGNTATSAAVTVEVGSVNGSRYASAVLDDGATTYWRLGLVGGNSDQVRTFRGVQESGAGTTTSGAVVGDSDGAATVNGTSSGLIRSVSSMPLEESFAVELWFKTSTRSGGKLVGYGNRSTGNSSTYDRHLYMRNDGSLVFGVYPGVQRSLATTQTYRDDQWHHAVAQLDPWAGIQLYVDGQLVASDPTVTSASVFQGFWRLGGDNLSGWPNRPSSDYFSGQLDEFAVYPQALTPAQISAHYATARGVSAPTASFQASVSDQRLAVDGSGSTAPGGRTITAYAWDFGDGSSATGVSAAHTYANPGTYTITLSVTDSAGLTGTTTRLVTATAPHTPPVADIAATAAGLTVDFSATGSSATAPATITGYRWDFGDGTTTEEPSPTKTYAESGTYTVTLRVTDDRGATSAAATTTVSVTAPDVAIFDDFERTEAAGWGSAVTGGAWSSPASLSVADGEGRITLSRSQTRAPVLGAIDAADLSAALVFSADKVVDGGGLHFSYVLHKSAAGEYRVKVRILASGAVQASITKLVGGAETTLGAQTLAGYTYAAGDRLHLRLDSQRTPEGTALSAKVWPGGATEPSAWTSTAVDSAPLPAAGSVGVVAYVTGTATNAPVVVSVDDLRVTARAASEPQPEPEPEPQPEPEPEPAFVARDDFERTVASGWGDALVGGAWTSTAGVIVADGVGRATMSPGQTRRSILTAVVAQDVDATVTVRTDTIANGGGQYVSYLVRRTDAGDYRLKVKLSASGVVAVSLVKALGATETTLASRTLSGYTHTTGAALRLRVQAVTSAGETTLNGSVWPDGTAEPGPWSVTAADSQPELQGAGQVGILTYLSGSTTNAPVTVSIDDLEVR